MMVRWFGYSFVAQRTREQLLGLSVGEGCNRVALGSVRPHIASTNVARRFAR